MGASPGHVIPLLSASSHTIQNTPHQTLAAYNNFPISGMRKAVTKFIGKKPDHSLYRIDHGSVEDFYIALDDPHKHFVAGDEISGQVILLSKKNLANIVITFSLCGYVKINASPQSKLRSMKHVLFNHTIKIYGPDLRDMGERSETSERPERRGASAPATESRDSLLNGLDKGEHRFPFVVKLPQKKIFTSLDFGKGAILYVLRTNLSTVELALSSLKSPANADAMAKMKSLSRLHHPSYSYEKTINLVSPADVALHAEPKLKRLTIKDPKRGRHRVQSSNSTINTATTVSSNNSDSESARNTAPSPSSIPNLPENPQTIRVAMEVAHGGFLRGELIPIKLSIHHLKKIQDTRGIIATLVRVCRIDYGPDGSYESFRKDLQQLVIPLYVDPVTLSLEISTSLRVPPDAFPTISGCPMVSFQYFIEVMLNLSGKTLSLEAPSEQPKSSMVPEEQGTSPGTPSGGSFNFHSYTQNRQEYINTDKYKRLKKFLQMTTEIMIGTHRLDKTNTPSTSVSSTRRSSTSSNPHPHNALQSLHGSNQQLHGSNTNLPHRQIGSVHEFQEVRDFATPPYNRPDGAPSYNDIVPPELPNLSEKQQMLQHEASLLPSEPQFDSDEESMPGFNPTEMEGSAEHVHNFDMSHDNDELYEIPDIHEGIGLEGDKDYVPNYLEAANDRLVDQDDNNETEDV